MTGQCFFFSRELSVASLARDRDTCRDTLVRRTRRRRRSRRTASFETCRAAALDESSWARESGSHWSAARYASVSVARLVSSECTLWFTRSVLAETRLPRLPWRTRLAKLVSWLWSESPRLESFATLAGASAPSVPAKAA